MKKIALTVGLTAVVAFAAGYATRGGAGTGTGQPGEAGAETRVPVRETGSAGNGPGARSRSGAAVGATGQRAFPRGEAGKWLESLKDLDHDDPVATLKLSQQCWAMDEEEVAELLAKCGEIMTLKLSVGWKDKESFPDYSVVESLAQEAALRLAGLSPVKALKLIKESEVLLDDYRLISMAFGAIADVDPALALAEVRGLEHKTAAVEGAMGRLLAAGDLFNAASLLKFDPDSDGLMRRFLNSALKSDPDLALATGKEIAAAGNVDAVELLMGSPATRQRTVEWAVALQGPEAYRIRAMMMTGLVEEDLPQAREVYSRIAAGMPEEQRTAAAGEIGAKMAQANEPWEPWLASLDEKSRQAAVLAIVGAEGGDRGSTRGGIMMLSDLVRGGRTRGEIEAVLDHPTLNQADFIGSVDEADPGSRAPSRAEELLGQMPASGEKSELLVSKARALMNSRPDEARLWVEQLPEGPEKVWLTREMELKAGLRLLELEKSRAKEQEEEQEITPDD